VSLNALVEDAEDTVVDLVSDIDVLVVLVSVVEELLDAAVEFRMDVAVAVVVFEKVSPRPPAM